MLLLLLLLLGKSWDRKWANYASMISIEIYNSSTPGNSDLFRVIYNGQQQQVEGCSSTGLCDVDYLLNALAFAQYDMPCGYIDSSTNDDYYIAQDDDNNNDDSNGNNNSNGNDKKKLDSKGNTNINTIINTNTKY